MLDLHGILNDIEASRWQDEREASLRERLASVQLRLSELMNSESTISEEAVMGFGQLEEVVSQHAPAEPSTVELRAPWADFRQLTEPIYEELAATLRGERVIVPRLRPTNYTRNIFHVGAALTSLLVVELLPELVGAGFWVVVVAATAFAAWGWSMEIGRRVSESINALLMKAFSLVAHPHEAHHINSATWYVSALLLLSLTFEPIVCTSALAVLGVGDPVAALIGKRFGRLRFENGRSVEGTAAFFVSGTLAALIALTVFHADLSLTLRLSIAAAAALTGGVTELVSRRLDDNLGIPVSAGAAAWLVLWLLGGAS